MADLPRTTDNRDLTTTWLWSEPMEVDPWDLVVNAVENAIEDAQVRKPILDHVRQAKSMAEEACDMKL